MVLIDRDAGPRNHKVPCVDHDILDLADVSARDLSGREGAKDSLGMRFNILKHGPQLKPSDECWGQIAGVNHQALGVGIFRVCPGYLED
jgi:hypothetical protein